MPVVSQCRQAVRSFGRSAFLFLALFLAGCEKKGTPRLPDVKPGEVMVLTEAALDAATAKGVVLVDFCAAWCPPCKTQGPIVAEVAAEMSGTKGVLVASLDADTIGPETIERFNMEFIPTLIIFKNGKPFKTFTGLTEKETLIEAINDTRTAK